MSASVDHALVERLLEDESLSYREIARRAGCSEWSIRSIARQACGNPRPVKKARSRRSADDGPPVAAASLAWWGVPVLVVVGIGIALLLRRGPGGAP